MLVGVIHLAGELTEQKNVNWITSNSIKHCSTDPNLTIKIDEDAERDQALYYDLTEGVIGAGEPSTQRYVACQLSLPPSSTPASSPCPEATTVAPVKPTTGSVASMMNLSLTYDALHSAHSSNIHSADASKVLQFCQKSNESTGAAFYKEGVCLLMMVNF